MQARLRRLAWLAVTCCLVMVVNCSIPASQADELDELNARRDQATVDTQQAHHHVDQAWLALSQADARVTAVQTRVAEARQVLTEAEEAWQTARDLELELARQLLDAEKALADAEAKVDAGQAKIDAQKAAINAYARSIVQDNLPLVNVALLIDLNSTASLANRVQWTDTVLTTNQVDLDSLRQIQAELVEARKEAESARQTADQARQAAADQLSVAESARQTAQEAQDALNQVLNEEQSIQAEAAQLLSTSQVHLSQAQATGAAIDQAIADEEARLAEIARQEEERRRQEDKGSTPYVPVSGGSIAAHATQMAQWGGSYLWGGGHASLADLQARIAAGFAGRYGVDCSGFVRAAIYTATGVDTGNWAVNRGSGFAHMFIEVSEADARPGDIFHTHTHTGVIIANDPQRGVYQTAESFSEYSGMGLSRHAYGYANDGVWRFIGA